MRLSKKIFAALFTVTAVAAASTVIAFAGEETESVKANPATTASKNEAYVSIVQADAWIEPEFCLNVVGPMMVSDGVHYVNSSYGYTKEGTNVYEIISGTYKSTGYWQKDTYLEITGDTDGYYVISYNGKEFYVPMEKMEVISYFEYEYALGRSARGKAIVEEAMRYIGTPYVYGGSSPRGFDCSGFAMYVYSKMGYSLPRVAASQAGVGKAVSYSELQPGDLVFFGSRYGIDHVGIYVGDGKMVHSPYPGRSVCVESISNSYFGPRYVCARRVY